MSFALLLLAIVPGLALLVFFYFRDRYKKEPLGRYFWRFCSVPLSPCRLQPVRRFSSA
jgi:RsiW-degrading membrane proteinase PrsW (M82 family)